MDHKKLLDVTKTEDLKLFAEWTQEDILTLAARVREVRTNFIIMIIMNIFWIGFVLWRGK